MNQGHKMSSVVLNRVAKRTIFVLTNRFKVCRPCSRGQVNKNPGNEA